MTARPVIFVLQKPLSRLLFPVSLTLIASIRSGRERGVGVPARAGYTSSVYRDE